jgi:protocatechuate 3,4-dioxygenase, alpha subunit
MALRCPSQTVGPFYHLGLDWKDGHKAGFSETGRRIVLKGTLIDGGGDPVSDALVETWQHSPRGTTPASAQGDGNPHGFARVQSRADGTFQIETLMPGGDVPCIDVSIFARGLLKALRTRVYLAPEDKVRGEALLEPLAGSARVKTLIAKPLGDSEYHWTVRLQGEGETVFFDF